MPVLMTAVRRFRLAMPLAIAASLAGSPVRAFDVVLNAQGEYLDAYLIDGSPVPRRVVFVDPDPPGPDDPTGPPARVGRHVNGKLCFFPKGFGRKGDFVIADDTYREACVTRRAGPQARCGESRRTHRQWVGTDPDGWGVFRRDGTWARRVIHVDASVPGPDVQGAIDPQGCAFDATGRLFGVDVGSGNFGAADGAIVVFFPGRRQRYDTYCYLDRALGAPGMPAVDGMGNLYIPEPAGFRVTRFGPPFPESPADCPGAERLVTQPPTKTVFLSTDSGLITPAGIARVPASDHFFIGSVLLPPIINEYDAGGAFVRTIAAENVPRNPLGIDVGADGTVYYAELNLDPMTFGTRCGSVSRVRFDDAGAPLPPERLGSRLRFPDGVTVVDSKRLRARWRKLPAAPDIDPAACGGEGE
jgi:hypothetical protein